MTTSTGNPLARIYSSPGRVVRTATAAALAFGVLNAAGTAPFSLATYLFCGAAGPLGVWLLGTAASAPRPPAFDLLRDAGVIVLLLAMSEPSARVWGAPATWLEVLRLSEVGSISSLALYLGAAAASRFGDKGRLSHTAAFGFLALPLVANLILLLNAPGLMRQLGELLTPLLAPTVAVATTIGRGATLFLINEIIAIGIAWLTDRRWPRNLRLHGLLGASAVLAVLAPWIADSGTVVRLSETPAFVSLLGVCAVTVVSQAALWGQTFLVTGILMDGLHGRRPDRAWAERHWLEGASKGAVYSGCLMLLLKLIDVFFGLPGLGDFAVDHAMIAGAVGGALVFPLIKTIVESFDGSPPFVFRLRASAATPENYFRGLVFGGVTGPVIASLADFDTTSYRVLAGAGIGALTYGGVDLLWDLGAITRGLRRRFQPLRYYTFGTMLGTAVGAALAWYFDPAQVAAVTTKFGAYVTTHYVAASGPEAGEYIVYPLFSKWGAMDLGFVAGGAKLLFSESLSGVINWSLAAPLFSINLVFLTAAVQQNTRPIREIFSRAGVVALVEQAFRVQRWGLWMAPVIYSFLRMAPEPSWYNQDGAIRSLAAIWQAASLDPAAFRAWSLEAFLGLLAYDWLRVLIWFDHMGLRVATLVNASFVVGDVVDEAGARFLGYGARARSIPEGIRRFATWGPLLIPFYIPRGSDWDYVWNKADVVRASTGPFLPPVADLVVAYAGCGLVAVGVVAMARWLHPPRRVLPTLAPSTVLDHCFLLRNGDYSLDMTGDGLSVSHVASALPHRQHLDLTPRPNTPGRPQGKFFYIREIDAGGEPNGPLWSATFEPARNASANYRVTQSSSTCIEAVTDCSGFRAETSIRTVGDDAVELRTLRLVNRENVERIVDVTSYHEIALAERNAYERHPAYQALHVGTCFVRPLGAILAFNRRLGIHVSRAREFRDVSFHAVAAGRDGVELTGYEDSRSLFIGRGTAADPEALRNEDFRDPQDEGLAYTFDPAASLRVRVTLPPGGSVEVRFVDGYAQSETDAAALIAKHLAVSPVAASELDATFRRSRLTLDRHRIAPDRDAYAFSPDGRELDTSSDTSRSWFHLIANELGHGAVVGNDGSMFSFAKNSQQNGLTPFIPETIPAQHIGQTTYVVDLDTGHVDTPGFVPSRNPDAEYSAKFGLGFAVLRNETAGTVLEQDIFVPPEDPIEVRLLRIHNRTKSKRRFRIVPYFELVLGEIARDSAGLLEVEADPANNTIWFKRPDNQFETGQAFVAWSLDTEAVETERSRFFGTKPHDPACPPFAKTGCSADAAASDSARIAAFAGTVEIAAGETTEIAIVIGQTSTRKEAEALIQRYASAKAAREASARTRRWWRDKLSALRIETDSPEFDRLINDWLPYQALTARLWGRTGPSQRSGGYGYRDQLQDVMPFAILDPDLARRQILLHAGRQFLEGDVLQWWHTAPRGAVGLGARNHASDPHLWLIHAVERYVAMTGDLSILTERVAFLEGPRVPRNSSGSVFVPRTSRDDAQVYEHCRVAVERTLARLGPNRLPYMGRGDWNDGLDALGEKGRGESVWLGLFLHDALVRMARLGETLERSADVDRYRAAAGELTKALSVMWRDDHFVRAISDNGDEVSFASALMSAWPVLSGAVDFERAKVALETGLGELEQKDLVLLLAPPFTPASRPYPGKIADYPLGVRENGGQYSHGASWLVDALVAASDRAAGKGEHESSVEFRSAAFRIWRKISPLAHCGPAELDRYGLPPHQQPADIYFGAGYEGRGGWSWYTGAASRMLTAAYALLGILADSGELSVETSDPAPEGTPRLKRVWSHGKQIFPA
jgi:cyclic beta-1,2-glucan synthetase